MLIEIGDESFFKHVLFCKDLYQSLSGSIEFIIEIEGRVEIFLRQSEFAHLNLHEGEVRVGFRLTDRSLELNHAFVPTPCIPKHQSKVVSSCTMAWVQTDRQSKFFLGTCQVIREEERITKVVEQLDI